MTEIPKRKQVGTLFGFPVYEIDEPIPFPDIKIGKMNLVKENCPHPAEPLWTKDKKEQQDV